MYREDSCVVGRWCLVWPVHSLGKTLLAFALLHSSRPNFPWLQVSLDFLLFQFKSEFGNKEFMIWATVSSQSCFCWLYRASSSLAAMNIINLISVLTIWWCPCVEFSPVLLEECVCYDQCIFLVKLYLSLPCFILHSKAKFACFPRCFFTSYFCIPVPLMKWSSFLVVSSKGYCRSS